MCNYSVTRSFISSLISFTKPPVQTSDPTPFNVKLGVKSHEQLSWCNKISELKHSEERGPSVNENDKTITSAAGSLAESETGERDDKRSKGGGGDG